MIDLVAMTFEQPELPAALRVPENHVAPLVRRGENAAVGRERDRLTPAVRQRITRLFDSPCPRA